MQLMQIEEKRARDLEEAGQRDIDKKEAKRVDAEAKASWKAETKATPFQCHKLPTELRKMIFEYALVAKQGKSRPGLLSADRFNQELRQEALNVYYGINNVTFVVLKNSPISRFEPSNLVLIKTMTLVIPW